MTRPLGLLVVMLGGCLALMGVVGEDGQDQLTPLTRIGLFVFGLAVTKGGVLMVRGQGKVFQELDAWFAIQQKKNEELMARGWWARLGFARPRNGAAAQHYDAVRAAQINAVTNPATAMALQNLQNLLYTQAITDEEFQAAKDKLLRSDAARANTDAITHITKLVELHRAGILNDVEFAAAKLKALGLA